MGEKQPIKYLQTYILTYSSSWLVAAQYCLKYCYDTDLDYWQDRHVTDGRREGESSAINSRLTNSLHSTDVTY